MKYSNQEIYCILLQGTCQGGQRAVAEAGIVQCSLLMLPLLFSSLYLILLRRQLPSPRRSWEIFFMGRKEQRETISEWIFDINSHFVLAHRFFYVSYLNCFTFMQIRVINA